VVTNVFSNVAAPVLPVAPQRNTEASGFGEVTNNREGSRTGRVGATAASGFGDALSGSREPGRPGKAGGIASASGFDSAATGGSQGGTNRGTVMAAGFAPVAPASRNPTATPQKPPDSGNEKPVEIILKPRPDYTDEARKMHIEGEVLLRVLFTSSGEVRVLEVLHGLGYGLNENAIRAAAQIRFKPAQRAGQPVDSAAIVHIAFQLAY
jgi:TonB family protein